MSDSYPRGDGGKGRGNSMSKVLRQEQAGQVRTREKPARLARGEPGE